MADDEKRPIIIRKVKKNKGGGHHGGAWKVAYADFVTAMMAFFLLLWLLNVTTDEQKALISSYFSPADPRIATSVSGSGGVLGGLTVSPDGAMAHQKDPTVSFPGTLRPDGTKNTPDDLQNVADKELEAELQRREQERFEKVEEQIRQAIETVPELKNLAQNLLIDQTPEGLRIQIVDQEGKPMFPLGKSEPLPEALLLLKLVTRVIMDLPNMISIRGHTDSLQYGAGAAYTNWELSADRANASRRAMLDYKLDLKRIENVMGKADREHLVKDDPTSARNRRITIILLKEALVPGLRKTEKKPKTPAAQPKKPENAKPLPKQPHKREEGIIYFP
ncbi:MAG: flagellar motor protein MotB [Pseudomonadota bacterium]|jgi:chemotaxis protein MotB|nr:motility protein MotB [Pseudomonadota bacterium]QKK05923.1 MAG: flagellar motor protein MotB [Pseudomonadota bacterium]